MRITFLRTRPAQSLAEPTVTSRRREGTTTVEIEAASAAELGAARSGGLLVLGASADPEPSGYLVAPEEALDLAKQGVPGWRITVRNEGPRELILDALARSNSHIHT